jgi:hypothetical protein
VRSAIKLSFEETNSMKRPNQKEPQTEIDCPACGGTGFPKVTQPSQPGRKIYPAPCKQCLGKRPCAQIIWALPYRPFSAADFADKFFRQVRSQTQKARPWHALEFGNLPCRASRAPARAEVPPSATIAVSLLIFFICSFPFAGSSNQFQRMSFFKVRDGAICEAQFVGVSRTEICNDPFKQWRVKIELAWNSTCPFEITGGDFVRVMDDINSDGICEHG